MRAEGLAVRVLAQQLNCWVSTLLASLIHKQEPKCGEQCRCWQSCIQHLQWMVVPAVQSLCHRCQPARHASCTGHQGSTATPAPPAGYGKTEALPYLDGNMRAEVVKAVFDFVHGTKKVLLSPSMSG